MSQGLAPAQVSLQALKKHTVPQLKVLCKEKGVTCYSKLGKDAIIQKILSSEKHRAFPRIPTDDSDATQKSSKTLKDSSHISTDELDVGNPYPAKKLAGPLSATATTDSNLRTGDSELEGNQFQHKVQDVSTSSNSGPTSCRKQSATPAIQKAPISCEGSKIREYDRKRNLSQHSSPPEKRLKRLVQGANGNTCSSNMDFSTATTAGSMGHHDDIGTSTGSNTVTSLSLPKLSTAGRRFKPLVAYSLKDGSGTAPNVTTRGHGAFVEVPSPVDGSASRTLLDSAQVSLHMDFVESKALKLGPVSLPPSISQRKQVPKLSLLFSYLDFDNLIAFSKLSRLFRFAAYMSALHQLHKYFHGKRLEDVIKQNPPHVTNFWPYLIQRQKERKSRCDIYRSSFIGRITQYANSISNRLWSSPDNDKQATIAARFLITHLYFCISFGLEDLSDVSKKQTILDVQEVVAGEIWMVKLQSHSSPRFYYVLESTCEVVGLPLVSPDSIRTELNPDRENGWIRADWSNYIFNRLHQSIRLDEPAKCLADHLQWPNHEEYDKGISKAWMSRTYSEGCIGILKRQVAERYIMACVVDNSLSGRMLTSSEMAHEVNGVRVDELPRRNPTKLDIHLFLPAHHHIESVHFTTRTGHALHIALAVIQTPGREYYILRDNGMQVGCEEDGVSPVWMDILQCDSKGVCACV